MNPQTAATMPSPATRRTSADLMAGSESSVGRLALEFLATGDYQHVFTLRGRPDDPWVYKIPAAFGYYLPRRHFWPRTLVERGLVFGLGRLPSGVWNRILRPVSDRLRRSRQLRGIARYPVQIGRIGIAGGARALSAYARRVRRRDFDGMLKLLEQLTRSGAADVVLPYRVLQRARATLEVGGRTFDYRGPILAQRKAHVFEGVDAIHSFDWRDLVDAQHHLWRHGFAFLGLREILGPKSWAHFEGHLRLADTSALTRRYILAHRCLRPERLDARERRVTRHLAGSAQADSCAAYFRVLRTEINQSRFEQLWCAAEHPAPAEASVGRNGGGGR